jgi:hypothetical protein
MTRCARLGVPLALALALVPAPATATGAAKQGRTIDIRSRLAAIAPITPTGAILAGDVRGRPVGLAAILVRTKTSPDGKTAEGSIGLFARKGTLKATIRIEIRPQPDGSTSYPGSFRIFAGSGAYRGARGSGTFNGTLPTGDTIYTFDVEGTVRF